MLNSTVSTIPMEISSLSYQLAVSGLRPGPKRTPFSMLNGNPTLISWEYITEPSYRAILGPRKPTQLGCPSHARLFLLHQLALKHWHSFPLFHPIYSQFTRLSFHHSFAYSSPRLSAPSSIWNIVASTSHIHLLLLSIISSLHPSIQHNAVTSLYLSDTLSSPPRLSLARLSITLQSMNASKLLRALTRDSATFPLTRAKLSPQSRRILQPTAPLTIILIILATHLRQKSSTSTLQWRLPIVNLILTWYIHGK